MWFSNITLAWLYQWKFSTLIKDRYNPLQVGAPGIWIKQELFMTYNHGVDCRGRDEHVTHITEVQYAIALNYW